MTRKQLIEAIEEEKKSVLNVLEYNTYALDFVNDYKREEIRYLCDAFSEYADNNTSIYYSDQRNFYNEHEDLCERALDEYGYNVEDLRTKDNMTLSDIICKAGQIGEYYYIEQQLYEEQQKIVKALCLFNLLEIAKNGEGNICKLSKYLNDLKYYNFSEDAEYIPFSYNDFVEVFD